jgi:uncharacterized protein YcbK (DUF882 family)
VPSPGYTHLYQERRDRWRRALPGFEYVHAIGAKLAEHAVRSAINRRAILSAIGGAFAFPNITLAVTAPPPRLRLKLVNVHTSETFEGTYRDDNGPIPSAMADLAVFLRDFHSSEIIAYDVAVLDFLAAVMSATGQHEAQILSAYRTRETNEVLARTTFGVAENSQHIYGRALDVHFGAKLADAMQAARAMRRGGVGWYPHSGFLHIDSGPVRNWDLDDKNLDALLNGAHHQKEPDDARYTAALKESGRVKPEMKASGQLRPEMAHINEFRPEFKRQFGPQ